MLNVRLYQIHRGRHVPGTPFLQKVKQHTVKNSKKKGQLFNDYSFDVKNYVCERLGKLHSKISYFLSP